MRGFQCHCIKLKAEAEAIYENAFNANPKSLTDYLYSGHHKDEGQRVPEDQRSTEIILLQQDRGVAGTTDNILKLGWK